MLPIKIFTDEFLSAAGDSGGRIHYDDAAIESLLDRSNEGIIEKESGMDDYLSSFKVMLIAFALIWHLVLTRLNLENKNVFIFYIPQEHNIVFMFFVLLMNALT